MTAKVIRLCDGGEMHVPGEPVPDIIAMLERVLDRARSGEMSAAALVTVSKGRTVGCEWHNADSYHNEMAAGVLLLHATYSDSMARDD